MLVFLILLAASGRTVYHVLTKALPSLKNPFASLTVSYLMAAAITFTLLIVFTGTKGINASFAELDFKSLLVGIALVCVETGFFYLYQMGGRLTVMQLFTSAAQTMMILTCGLLIFRERINLTNLSGIVLSVIGIFLVGKK